MTFWDKIAGLYDIAEGINGKVYREMLRMVRQLTPKGAVVLDTAAGTGQLSFASARNAERVVCTDLSLPMLKQARKNAAARGITNIEFAERDIFHLPEADNTYDIVMAGNVLHLIDDPERAVRELYRVAKPGGLLLLPTFMNESDPLLIRLYKRIGFSPASDFTPKEYKSMLKRCCLGEVKTKYINGLVPCCFAAVRKPK